jgi:hypothetical protein
MRATPQQKYDNMFKSGLLEHVSKSKCNDVAEEADAHGVIAGQHLLSLLRDGEAESAELLISSYEGGDADASLRLLPLKDLNGRTDASWNQGCTRQSKDHDDEDEGLSTFAMRSPMNLDVALDDVNDAWGSWDDIKVHQKRVGENTIIPVALPAHAIEFQ